MTAAGDTSAGTVRSVLFAALPGPGREEAVRARAGALRELFGTDGRPGELELRQASGVLLGRVGGPPGSWSFGRRVPRDDAAWLAAGDGVLRRDAHGPLAVVAHDGDRARVIHGVGGFQALYEADGPLAHVWSTHVLACAALSGCGAEADAVGVAEQLALEFTSGTRTILRGVRAVEPGTVVDIRDGRASARSFQPYAERWRPMAPREAAAAFAGVLTETAGAATAGATHVTLGLTAGLDSRVAACALLAAGATLRGLTWAGDDDEGDVPGARRAAEALGIDHATTSIDFYGASGMPRAREEVRWQDAGVPLGWGRIRWPPDLGVWASGLGGETGRRFYWSGWHGARATAAARLAALDDVAASHLAGAPPALRRALRAGWAAELERAEEAGWHGWRSLDVYYGEHRVRRWGRGALPGADAPAAGVFAHPRMQALLASLPEDDQRTARPFIDLLRRHGLEGRAPEPAAPPAGAWSRRTRLALLDARRRLPVRAREAPGAWFRAEPWSGRPAFLEAHLGALEHRVCQEVLGAAWARHARAGLLSAHAVWWRLAGQLAAICSLVDDLEAVSR